MVCDAVHLHVGEDYLLIHCCDLLATDYRSTYLCSENPRRFAINDCLLPEIGRTFGSWQESGITHERNFDNHKKSME